MNFFLSGQERANQRNANAGVLSGDWSELGAYLFAPDEMPAPLMISGGGALDRAEILYYLLCAVIGLYPVVILHNYDDALERRAIDALRDSESAGREPARFFNINALHASGRLFEPFYGMDAERIHECVKRMAKTDGYAPDPLLGGVVRAHVRILDRLNKIEAKEKSTPAVTLTGLYYLTREYEDLRAFREMVFSLPWESGEGESVWAELRTDTTEGKGQFALFRETILRFAGQAAANGWNDGIEDYKELNCMRAIRENAVILIAIDNSNAELFLEYLSEELKTRRGNPLLLIADNVYLGGGLLDMIRKTHAGLSLCLTGENAAELVEDIPERGGHRHEAFSAFAERFRMHLLLKHNTWKTAAVFSELIGHYDEMRTETSAGRNYKPHGILADSVNENSRNFTENRFRVTPEEIIALGSGQAIVFDTFQDKIIRFNA